ncbi:MAG: 8-oxoguanine DNA glycosylase [candidate division WS6 bacterium GW2011_GWF2_39_15]|uniref:DNA-(apurinic or apyrimidinic site) lyase n=1 Tax=candidate division WS6 bacterium GW2011_GWF2_39_15 TaxID=1619100 RepID=A0A0G0MTI4_9BACT|nr:MAG: 8-oxoguanine DNA glycosylase [candidate division WS6 bacterium GW2011_GWF2_39_15]
MNKLFVLDFDFYTTFLGGQSFSWDYEEGLFKGFTSQRYIEIKREQDHILWQTYPVKDDIAYLTKYLRLDVNYRGILKKFPEDEYIGKAKDRFPGLRLLSQDFQDTLLGFLCSSNKSVKAIRKSIRNLREMYGEEISVNGKTVKLFPKLESISVTSKEKLLSSGVGFRAGYILEAANRFVKRDFENIENMDYEQAKELLIANKGIGDKVADCILLYSLKHDHIMPLDVWGKRILSRYYNLDESMRYNEMQDWVSRYFNGVGGWAGQMLFEYIRGFK